MSESARTLLVVDSDPFVRKQEAEALSQQGYCVLQANSAAEALRLAASPAAIHLLITNFALPEINGLELTRQFRAAHPSIPVLMVSASLPLLRDGALDLDHFEILAKPFGVTELVSRVRALLDVFAILPIRKPWCCD